MKRPVIPALFVTTVLLAASPAWAAGKTLGATLPLWSVLPFVGLLLSIAILPLATPHWWHKNRNRAIVSLSFGLPVAIYVALQPHGMAAVGHELHEYVSFIVLLGALYIISGGLVLRGNIQGTPRVNTIFLALGSILANFIGTTGASMVLIRPMLRTNAERQHTRHIPIFFIFIVANMGGMLTPLGDPPLFLGYLRGVPFFWTLRLAPIWLMAVGITLLVFYFWDWLTYQKEMRQDLRRDAYRHVPLALHGKRNLVLLGGVIGTVFLPSPSRELGMATLSLISLRITRTALREENRFTYHPIIEVAVIFIGIFLAMIPALAILQARGEALGVTEPWQFFWATGILSSLLDNAPTYVSFLSLAQGLPLAGDVVGVPELILMAISASAVLMGANTYIGNGPNFMVKAIAEEAGYKMPSFFGYMLRAALILLPIYALVTLVFFRG